MHVLFVDMANNRRAVTPVIATIILIAATIVLSLVVGAYVYGLFGSNVKTVTAPTANLYSGTASTASGSAACGGIANLGVSVMNQGSASYVKSVSFTGGGLAAGTVGLFAIGSTCVTSQPSGSITAGSSYLTIYSSNVLATGQLYNYIINFGNGQSVTGYLIAQ